MQAIVRFHGAWTDHTASRARYWLAGACLLLVPLLFSATTVLVGGREVKTVAVAPSEIGRFVRVEDLYTGREKAGAMSGLPVVWFRLQNIGTRTITDATVRVSFLDRKGASIHEMDFHPIHGGYDPDGSARPLKPGRRWQMPFNIFYMPKDIPWVWKTGAARAEVVALRLEAD